MLTLSNETLRDLKMPSHRGISTASVLDKDVLHQNIFRSMRYKRKSHQSDELTKGDTIQKPEFNLFDT